MLAINLNKQAKFPPVVAFGLVYIALAVWFIPGYVLWDANLIMGVLLAPYVCRVDRGRYSLRYLIPAVLTLGLAIIAPVNTLFFMAMLFAVLLLVENTLGKVSEMLLFLLLLISPVFGHISRLAEFPARLWLTENVAKVLTATGTPAASAGNMISLDGYEFSVDPSCAGLKMLVLSVLIALFVLAYYQRQTSKRLSFKMLVLLCLATVALNVVCNFFRILLLVAFKIMPGTLMHDLVGIVCLCTYVLAPLLLSIRPAVNRWGRPTEKGEERYPPTAIRYPYLHLVFAGAMIFVAMHLAKADTLITANNSIQLSGYHKTKLDGGILKFEDQKALIYLKPTAFYAPEHNPMICWVGSGYEFTAIKPETISGISIYTATLVKDNDKIYAAWWFDNGRLKTTNQFAWRWDAARSNSRFYLINVNAATKTQLQQQVTAMLKQDIFMNSTLKPKK